MRRYLLVLNFERFILITSGQNYLIKWNTIYRRIRSYKKLKICIVAHIYIYIKNCVVHEFYLAEFIFSLQTLSNYFLNRISLFECDTLIDSKLLFSMFINIKERNLIQIVYLCKLNKSTTIGECIYLFCGNLAIRSS